MQAWEHISGGRPIGSLQHCAIIRYRGTGSAQLARKAFVIMLSLESLSSNSRAGDPTPSLERILFVGIDYDEGMGSRQGFTWVRGRAPKGDKVGTPQVLAMTPSIFGLVCEWYIRPYPPDFSLFLPRCFA